MFSDGKALLSLIAYNKISLVFFLFFFLLIPFILLIESHLKRWLKKIAMIFVGGNSLYQILIDLDKECFFGLNPMKILQDFIKNVDKIYF